MSSLEDRLRKPEYLNWIKVGQAVRLVGDGLRKFTDTTIKDYHGQLKTHLGSATCQKQCKAKKDPDPQGSGGCLVCSRWKEKLMSKHMNKRVFWRNVDPKLWPLAAWEMAKFYMPSGQKHNKPITANDLDATHMMNLLNNCTEFHQYFSNKNLPQKVWGIEL